MPKPPARSRTQPKPTPASLWTGLNPRQQTYLTLIYQVDQETEADERSRYTRGERSRPAAEWRWLAYKETAYGPTKLKRLLRDAGLVNAGTGSTFVALEHRGLLECQSYGSNGACNGVSTAAVDVKLTTLGRRVVRLGLGLAPVKRSPVGILRNYQWEALAACYAAGFWGLGLQDEQGKRHWGRAFYGGFSWQTWVRLRDYKGGALVEAYDRHQHKPHRESYWEGGYTKWRTVEGWTSEPYLRLTPWGEQFYREHWQQYRERYPEIAAPEPSPGAVPESAKAKLAASELLHQVALRVRQQRGSQGLRAVATALTLKFGVEVSPSSLSQVEAGRLPGDALKPVLEQWLGVDLATLTAASQSRTSPQFGCCCLPVAQ